MAVWLVVVVVCVWSIPVLYAEERVRIAMDVRNSVITKPSVLAGALREAAAIWAPYGVVLQMATRTRRESETATRTRREGETATRTRRESETATLTPRHGDANRTTVVPVTLESARTRGQHYRHATPLGWVGFRHDGEPMRISLFYDAIARVAADGVIFGRRAVHTAALLEERIVARVLGRTLAHEVGHVVLRTLDHSASGLMRANQSVDELQHPSTAGFALEERDLLRLRRVFTDH